MALSKIKNWFSKPLKQKNKVSEFSFAITKHNVDSIDVSYAQWLHPKESTKTFKQNILDTYKEIIPKGSFVIDIGAHTPLS